MRKLVVAFFMVVAGVAQAQERSTLGEALTRIVSGTPAETALGVLGPAASAMQLSSVDILLGGADPAFVARSRPIGDAEATVFAQTLTLDDGRHGLVYGMKMDALALDQLVPGLPPDLPRLPKAILAFSTFEGLTNVPIARLHPAITALFSDFRMTGAPSLSVGRSMSFRAIWPLSSIPPTVLSTLELSAESRVTMDGTIGVSLDEVLTRQLPDIVGYRLRGTMPVPQVPGGFLPEGAGDVRAGTLALDIGYTEVGAAVSVEMTFSAMLDGARQQMVARLATMLGGRPQSISAQIQLSEPWRGPLGLSGVTLENAGLQVDLGRGGRSGLAAFGEVIIGTTRASARLSAGAGSGVQFTADTSNLPLADFWQFARGQLNLPVPDDLPLPVRTVRDASISLTTGAASRMSLAGIAEVDAGTIRDVALRIESGRRHELSLDLGTLDPGQLAAMLGRYFGIDAARLDLVRRLPVVDGLTFSLEREERGPASFRLEGGLRGTWRDALGIPGFDLDRTRLIVSQDAIKGRRLALSGGMRTGDLSFTGTAELRRNVTGTTVAVAATDLPDVSVAGMADFFVRSFGGLPLPEDLPADIVIRTPSLSFEIGAAKSLTLAGRAGFGGRDVPFVLGAIKPSAGPARFLAGFRFASVSITELVPALKGLEGIRFPDLALVVAKADRPITTATLPPGARALLASIAGNTDLSIPGGIRFLGAIPLSTGPLAPALKGLNKLGVDADRVLLSGAVSAGVFGGRGPTAIELRAQLPALRPPSDAGWMRHGTLSLLVRAGAGRFAVGVEGVLGVTIKEDLLDFGVRAEIDVGRGGAFNLTGRLASAAGAWRAPFGVKWLTLRQTEIEVSFAPATSSLGLRFLGDLDVATKNLYANVGTKLNVVTGVPTELLIHAKSTTPFGVEDLLVLQENIARTAGRPVRIPRNVMPQLEIAPLGANRPMEMKIDLSATGLPAVALKGLLKVGLAPGARPERIAGVDVDVRPTSIKMKGDVTIRTSRLGMLDLSLGSKGLTFASGAELPYAGTVVRVVADGAKCGFQKVTDAGKCGVDTVSRTVQCGWKMYQCGTKVVTDGAICGFNWWGDLFAGRKPRTCRTARYCQRERYCQKTRRVAKTCTDLSRPKRCPIDTTLSGSVGADFAVTVNNRGFNGQASGRFCMTNRNCQGVSGGSVGIDNRGLRLCLTLPAIGQQCTNVGRR